MGKMAPECRIEAPEVTLVTGAPVTTLGFRSFRRELAGGRASLDQEGLDAHQAGEFCCI